MTASAAREELIPMPALTPAERVLGGAEEVSRVEELDWLLEEAGDEEHWLVMEAEDEEEWALEKLGEAEGVLEVVMVEKGVLARHISLSTECSERRYLRS